MKALSKMAYVNIIDRTYDKLKGQDVTYENIKNSFAHERDFDTLRIFLTIYVKGVFRVYYDKHSEDHIRKVMEIRKAFYLHEPDDIDSKDVDEYEKLMKEEYEELMQYYESVEDYETCISLKKNYKIVA